MSRNEIIWFAVVNPNAGSGKTLAKWRDAEPLLYAKGIRYKFVKPESSRDSARRIKAACNGGFRHFIAVGGDGTVHQVMKAIIEYVDESRRLGRGISLSDFTLAVLPIGSGNDWIRSHHVPSDHGKIIDLIAADSFNYQDVVKAQILDPESGEVTKTAYMANIGGYSFDANICDVVNFQKANGVTGKVLYINALRSQAFSQKPYRTKVVCDGKEVFDDLLYSISFGNGLYSGGGLCQTPSAVMDDGLLDIMIAPKFPMWRVFFNIGKLLEHKAEQIPFLQFHKCRSIDVIPYGQGQLVEIDGEIIGRAPVHLEVMSEQIRVLDVRV